MQVSVAVMIIHLQNTDEKAQCRSWPLPSCVPSTLQKAASWEKSSQLEGRRRPGREVP